MGHKAAFVALFGCSAAFGCDGDSSVPLARTTQAPLIVVSDRLNVEAAPTVTRGQLDRFSMLQVRCGTERCLAVHRQIHPGYGWGYAYANRVSLDGQLQDALPIPVAYGTYSVVAAHDEFLIRVMNVVSGERQWWQMDGTTGDLTELAAQLTLPENVASLIPNDRSYLAAGSDGQLWVLDRDTLAPVGPPLTAPTPRLAVPGPSQFLSIEGGSAFRISATTGERLDAEPLVFSQRLGVAGVRATYQDGYYFLLVDVGLDWVISRIRASDGAVFDPVDETGQGGHPVCIGCSDAVAIGTVQGQLTVVGAISSDTLVVERIDPETGEPSTDADRIKLDLADDDVNAIELHAKGGLVLGYESVYPFSVSLAWSLTASSGLPLKADSTDRTRPLVAGNGQDYLVVWNAADHILATRVNGVSGAYLDDPPLSLGTGAHSVSASNGTDYVVAWTRGQEVHRAVVRATGRLDGAFGPLDVGPTAEGSLDSLRLASDGDGYLLLWRRKGSSTEQLTALPLDPNGAAAQSELDVATDSYLYPALAGVSADSDGNRQFLVAYASSPGEMWYRWYRPDDHVLGEARSLGRGRPSVDFGPSAASDGARVVLLWPPWPGGVARASLLQPGSPDVAAEVESVPQSLLWWDGLTWISSPWPRRVGLPTPGPIRLQRFDSSLGALEDAAAGVLLDEAAGGLDTVHAASNGDGRSLIAYSRLDPERLSTAINVRLVDYDGELVDTSDAGPSFEGGMADGPLGTGDAAGLADVRGVAPDAPVPSDTGPADTMMPGEAKDASAPPDETGGRVVDAGTPLRETGAPAGDGPLVDAEGARPLAARDSGCGCRIDGCGTRSDAKWLAGAWLAGLSALARLRRGPRCTRVTAAAGPSTRTHSRNRSATPGSQQRRA